MGDLDVHSVSRDLRHTWHYQRRNLGQGIDMDSTRHIHCPIIGSRMRSVHFLYYLEIPEACIEYMVSTHFAMEEMFGHGQISDGRRNCVIYTRQWRS